MSLPKSGTGDSVICFSLFLSVFYDFLIVTLLEFRRVFAKSLLVVDPMLNTMCELAWERMIRDTIWQHSGIPLGSDIAQLSLPIGMINDTVYREDQERDGR